MSHLRKNFPNDFRMFWGDELTSDVMLTFEDEEFKVHKLVLSLHSDVFKTLFYGENFKEKGKKVIEIENSLEVSVEIFKNFLKYLYSNELEINQNNVVKLYELSDYYSVGHLKRRCIQSLYEEIRKGDYFPALEMVNKYYDEELLRLCINVISRTVRREDNMEHFCQHVSYSSLLKVLNNDYFNIGEEKVLQIAHKYMYVHGDENAQEIMKCVRFHLLNGKKLVHLMKPLVDKNYVSQSYFTECLVYQFDKSGLSNVKSRRIGFTWDYEDMKSYHDCFIVGEDHLNVKREKSTGVNPSIRTKIPLSRDNNLFLTKLNKWNCIGVCSKSFRLMSEFVGNDTSVDSGFGIYIGSTTSNCYVKNNSKSVDFQIKPSMVSEGDLIGIKLEEPPLSGGQQQQKDRVIRFLLNGEDLGVATVDNNVEYYPCISIGHMSEWKIIQ